MNLKLRFLGVGNAFCSNSLYQSNVAIELPDNKLFLIDCGSDIRHSMKECYPDINNGNVGKKIKYIYISHIHSDHVGGLEWPAFCTYFSPEQNKNIGLLVPNEMYNDLWDETLKGSLKTVTGKDNVCLQDYFKISKLINGFNLKDHTDSVKLDLVKSIHIKSSDNKFSYGLFIRNGDKKTYYTTDVIFENYKTYSDLYNEATLIFHDCETTPFKSGVHSHYEELLTLPDDIKSKMYLYHYSDDALDRYNPIEDGFLGFVKKDDVYDI